MGQFEDNSMTMQVRGFDVDDPCVMEMRMCAEAKNANDVLSFNFDTSGQIRDRLRGTMEVRGAEYRSDTSHDPVLYMDSSAEWERVSKKLVGISITDVPVVDTMSMQVAVDMADIVALDEGYMRVQTSNELSLSDTTVASMNALSGMDTTLGDAFPQLLVATSVVGQCSLSAVGSDATDNQVCDGVSFLSPTSSPTAVARAPSVSTTGSPTIRSPTREPTASPTTGSPTGAPTFSVVAQVKAVVVFPGLNFDDFTDDPAFNAQFRSEYKAALAAEASVSASQVEIEIYAGSVIVDTIVTFDSIEADGDHALVEERAASFFNALNTAPAKIFEASTSLQSLDVSVASIEKVATQSRTGAPTLAQVLPSSPPPPAVGSMTPTPSSPSDPDTYGDTSGAAERYTDLVTVWGTTFCAFVLLAHQCF